MGHLVGRTPLPTEGKPLWRVDANLKKWLAVVPCYQYSLPLFWCFEDQKEICVPNEVVGEGSLRAFKPFVFADYDLKFLGAVRKVWWPSGQLRKKMYCNAVFHDHQSPAQVVSM